MNVFFSSGVNGKKDAGLYRFFLLVGRQKHNRYRNCLIVRTKGSVWDRTRKLAPGEFGWFNEDCQMIMRASRADVELWLEKHPDDAPFAVLP